MFIWRSVCGLSFAPRFDVSGLFECGFGGYTCFTMWLLVNGVGVIVYCLRLHGLVGCWFVLMFGCCHVVMCCMFSIVCGLDLYLGLGG